MAVADGGRDDRAVVADPVGTRSRREINVEIAAAVVLMLVGVGFLLSFPVEI